MQKKLKNLFKVISNLPYYLRNEPKIYENPKNNFDIYTSHYLV